MVRIEEPKRIDWNNPEEKKKFLDDVAEVLPKVIKETGDYLIRLQEAHKVTANSKLRFRYSPAV